MKLTKVCCKCKIELNILLFSKNKVRSDGYASNCKPCDAKRYKEWASENMGANVEKHREFRHKEKEKFISKIASIPEIPLPDIDYE